MMFFNPHGAKPPLREPPDYVITDALKEAAKLKLDPVEASIHIRLALVREGWLRTSHERYWYLAPKFTD